MNTTAIKSRWLAVAFFASTPQQFFQLKTNEPAMTQKIRHSRSHPCLAALRNLFLLGAMLALPVAAQDKFTVTTNNGAITITRYTGSGGVVTIPDTIHGLSVTSIGDSAFAECRGLTSVTIPNSVTSIGDSAFDLCYSLTSVAIPYSVTSIGGAAFDDCSGLTNIAVDAANPNYASAGGVLFNKTLTTLVEFPGGLTGSYAIPNSVTNIGDCAFDDTALASVIIPDRVTSIGHQAFYGCWRLTTVTTGKAVTCIGDWAFANCSVLTNLTIPNSVTNIDDYAFAYCSALATVTIPDSVTSIGSGAFEECSGLTNVTIGNSVRSIGDSAFWNCTNLHQAFFQGNAPSVDGGAGSADSTVFERESGTAHHLPGATGWGATFGGWPTAAR